MYIRILPKFRFRAGRHCAAWLVVATCVMCFSEVAAQVVLIPQPAQMKIRSGYFNPPGLSAERIGEFVERTIDPTQLAELGAEGYALHITRGSVQLTAATQTGAYYGLQSLEQLIGAKGIPCAEIKDKPRFGYRGIHLDVSRHFFPKEEVFRLLDEMARYKLNKFHFHLTDNGGWRIEIKNYPLLTREGAYRTQRDWYRWWDKKDRRYLTEGTPGAYGGYYTQAEIREIVAYAAQRHIEVIPEIEFPAHSDAVFVGYPELCCEGKAYTSGEFCVANEAVYRFMEEVLSEVIELFPSRYIHIGGDEARRVAWKTCPKCQALIEREGMHGVEDLQVYMIDRIQQFVRSKGRTMIGWDEILHNRLDSETVVMSYRGQKGAIEAANRGNYAVMTPGEVLYFDWYQADPSTQLRAMYGYTPIRKMYAFEPVPTDPYWAAANESIIRAEQVEPDSVRSIAPDKADRIIGVQGCAWSEYFEDEQQLEYMVFPRLLAIAEMGWTPRDGRTWPDFKRRMNCHIPRLQQRGIRSYTLGDEIEIETRLLPRKGWVEVTLDNEREPVEIRYTTDGTTPTAQSARYEKPFAVQAPCRIQAVVFRGGVMQKPLLDRTVDADRALRNYYPFVVPDAWKEGY